MHRSSTVYKWKQFKTNKSVYFDVRGQQGIDLSTGGSVIIELYFAQNQWFDV